MSNIKVIRGPRGAALHNELPFLWETWPIELQLCDSRKEEPVTWTRAQVAAEHLAVTVATVRSWERSTGFRPAGASAFQEFSPTVYDSADIAILQIIQHASDIGLTGTHLGQVHDSVAPLRPHFLPGWTGLCVTTTDLRAWLVGPGVPGPDSVDTIAAALDLPTRIQTIAPVVVPQ